MRRAALLCLVTAACGSNGSTATGTIAAHVTHYDYTFDITSRAAHAAVTLGVDTAGNCITLPFRATALANVLFDGASPATITQGSNDITVCGDGQDAGSTFVVEADATVAIETISTSQVGFSITNDSEGNPFTYLVSWVNGCDHFAPCDNAPDVFATYTFDVTHDPALTVRCPGHITDKSATETVCDFDYAGGPTYSTFGIAAYPAWTQTDKGTWGDVAVTVYDRASTGIAAAIDPVYHGGFITWMESQFGPFPYGTELRVLTAPTYWSGFEHPGNIVIDDGLAHQSGGYRNNVAHTLDHEMTHMWAGDQTTLAATYDFAWKESMAEYLSYVWEDMNDPTVSIVTANVWKLDAAPAKYYPVPQDKPDLFTYYGDVYGPGPMIFFHQLEVMSSRAQVIAAIKSVIGSPHALSVDDLIAALETQTGLDLTQYMAGWLKGSGAPSWPQLALTYTAGAGTDSIAIHVTNPSPSPRSCKFHINVRGASSTNVTSVAVDAVANPLEQTVTFPTPAYTVTALDLDPSHECLVYLYNSSLPRTEEPAVRPWVSQRFQAITR